MFSPFLYSKRFLDDSLFGIREKYLQRFLFIHINKTGGSSIEKALGIRSEHKTALEKMQQLGSRAWEKKYKFTIVRNPWDKVVSHYLYRVKTNQTALGVSSIDFKEWVRLTYQEQDPEYMDIPLMFKPQMDWITDEKGKVLVDFIGKFENLERDFNSVCEHLGISAKLPHLKKTTRERYNTYYDDRTIEIVANWFERDIDYFGYEF